MTKVFCKDCEFFDEFPCMKNRGECRHTNNYPSRYIIIDPIRGERLAKGYAHASPQTRNANFDCKDFNKISISKRIFKFFVGLLAAATERGG